MNLLLDELPESLDVGGKIYSIHSDFRTWIRVENLIFWDDSPWEARIAQILYTCYGNSIPFDINAAMQAAIEFYNCNGSKKNTEAQLPAEEEAEQKLAGQHNRLYSFDYDAGLIYAAFRAQYGINLQTVALHWWEFSAMFSGLEESNKICKIMEYRSADLSSIKDKGQKAFYRRMKRIFRLPDLRSEEEKEAAMVDALAAMF